MSVVNDLLPGDLVHVFGITLSGIFIAKAPHPDYPGLMLVIWRLSDGELSFDALLPDQDIGHIESSTGEERGRRLLKTLKEET